MALVRGFKARANRIAVDVRIKMGLPDHAPIDPEAVCDHYEIVLEKLSEVAPGSPFLNKYQDAFSAVTVPRGIVTAITHNDSHHPHRQHSNICHELAHCFLGHESAPPLLDDGSRSRDSVQEEEAHFLSGALLITNEAANRIMSMGLYYQAEHIYGVSKVMLDYRLRVSGALKRYERRMGYAK